MHLPERYGAGLLPLLIIDEHRGQGTLRNLEVVAPQAFRRMVRSVEFDVCEMAFTTYLVAKAHGKPFTALPVFLVRGSGTPSTSRS